VTERWIIVVNIGINLGFAALNSQLTDEQMYHSELELGVVADRLGYDAVWVVEHHFSDYSLCPDNLLMLAHLAGRTSQIKLGTAAVIVPWNNPLRVVEKALMVDNISGGRLLVGLGRGLSRREYEPFRVTLGETRDRFDEAAPMIFDALETGVIEGSGPFYQQPRAELRPRPRGSFIGRRYCVAGSPESVVMTAKLRAGLMSFIVRPVPDLMPTFTDYRERYEAQHGETPPPISLAVNMYCHEDEELAQERNYDYVSRFFMSNIEHYEMAGEHFEGIKGHERYATNAAHFREIGLEKAANNYIATTLWGNPKRILGQIEAIRDVLGDFDLSLAASHGGMPHDQARASLELFAREVMPKANTMSAKPAGVSA
jgi:alkanesulfonate monooxygenase SsuD/methylene tetrahydromethanopterin reductase-like flavin-dependent oxidoreductase (luciferase family)